MNPFKQEWMIHAGLIPEMKYTDNEDGSLKVEATWDSDVADATAKTLKAAGRAIVIAQMDGPLPVADLVAVAVFTIEAVAAWWDVFS